MQGVTAQAARDAIMEIKEIATQGLISSDDAQQLTGALRRVIRAADANARMLDEVSQAAAPGEREGGHIQNT